MNVLFTMDEPFFFKPRKVYCIPSFEWGILVDKLLLSSTGELGNRTCSKQLSVAGIGNIVYIQLTAAKVELYYYNVRSQRLTLCPK